MAPKTTESFDEVEFIKTCLKYFKEPMNKANFDFDKIATDVPGVKDSTAA
jgi:hypothetical protein